MDYEKLLRALLSKAYKLDAGGIKELLELTDETEAETKLLEIDKTRIKDLGPKTGQTFQDGYKKAKAEVLTELEAELKEKYGVDNADIKGVKDIVDLVISEKEAAGGKPGALTDEDVKKHAAYQKMEREFKKQLTDKDKAHTQALTEKETEFVKKQTLSQIKEEAWDLIVKDGPVLPKNPKIQENLKQAFFKELEAVEFTGDKGARVVMIDNKVVTDDHGHTLDFKDFVKNKASDFYEFQANNGGSNGGNDNNNDAGGNNEQQGGYPAGITIPKTFADVAKIVNDSTIATDVRSKTLDAWEAQNGAK